ncbi:MAG TPA: succinylglutamate desuccinylase/aspartoacylase family protein [Bacillota bacterium]|jgi:hypothetical protein
MPPRSGTAIATAAGKPAIVAESGDRGLCEEEAVQVHVRGVRNILSLLGVLDGGVRPEDVPLRPNSRFVWQRSNHLGIFYPAVKLLERVQKGQVLGHVRDHFGEPLEIVTAAADGEILFIITCPPVARGDSLLAIGTER